jgi:hypothetical protein
MFVAKSGAEEIFIGGRDVSSRVVGNPKPQLRKCVMRVAFE